MTALHYQHDSSKSYANQKYLLRRRERSLIKFIIIRSKFFFLFIGRQSTTWPANNCLQKMVFSCAMPSNSVWLQIIFCSCIKETVLFSFLRPLLHDKTRMIRQLLNSVIAKYRDFSVSRMSIIWLSFGFGTDKSQYFA